MKSFFFRVLYGFFAFCFVIFLVFGVTANSVLIDSDCYNYSDSSNISIVPVNYQTDIVYSDKLSKGNRNVLREGVVGYAISETNVVLVEPINEVVEVGSGISNVSYGSTTGYGADCVGCSGNVSCRTFDGRTHNLIRDGIYYNDSKYGEVRIVAADHSKFKCGTILSIDNGILDPFMAIVMDTGSAMRNAWKNGNILIDIAFSYENSSGIHNATNRSGNVKFEVYRNGW